MLLLVNAGLLGDALCTLPAICMMADDLRTKGEKLFVVHTNQAVLNFIPQKFRDMFVTLGSLEHIGCVENLDTTQIIVMSASKAWQAGINDLHMAQGHMRYLGLPTIPPHMLNLEYEKWDVVPYDFLISPYSRSNYMNNKLWPYDRWQQVINWLNSKGMNVAVLGAGEDPAEVFTGVEYLFNCKLNIVASHIERVNKAILTIDNGISHLAAFLKAPHFGLMPQCLPPNWITDQGPNSVWLREEPLNITVDEVIAGIEKVYF
jgi:hypothetical protein